MSAAGNAHGRPNGEAARSGGSGGSGGSSGSGAFASSAKSASSSSSVSSGAQSAEGPLEQAAQPEPENRLFGRHFSEKEQKRLFMYLVVGIVLLEMAITVGALVYSITNAVRVPGSMPRFNFPWLGYLVSVVLAPALVMLVIHLLSLGFTRTLEGEGGAGGSANGGVSGRAGAFFALVRGAPTVILFAGFVLMGAAIYYLDGVMALLLKLGDSFQTVAVWLVGAFAVAWTASTVTRMILTYKARQMDAEYAFRREVLHTTGMVILDARHAPTTELRMLPAHDGVTSALSPASVLTLDAGSVSEKVAGSVSDEVAGDLSEKATGADLESAPDSAGRQGAFERASGGC